MNCEEWLKNLLYKNGFYEVNDVRKLAKGIGFSKKELTQAKTNLGVKAYHHFTGKTDVRLWYWYIPQDV